MRKTASTNEHSNDGTSEAWFAATIIFASAVGGKRGLRPLCEERVVLFRIGSVGEATAAAERHARSEEHSYRNSAGDEVKWTFVAIEKVEDVTPRMAEGWEVGSRYSRRSLHSVRKKGSKRAMRRKA